MCVVGLEAGDLNGSVHGFDSNLVQIVLTFGTNVILSGIKVCERGNCIVKNI